MEFNKIKFIRTLLSDPNLGYVASRYGTTQSALSKRIQAIEQEIGFPLFERRGPKGLAPLPQAYHFAELVDQVSGLWKKGIERMSGETSGENTFMIIGPQLFIREVFLPWWHKNDKSFEHIQLEIRIPALKVVSLETLRIQADAAIIEKKEDLLDHVCKKIYSEQWGIVRSASAKDANLQELNWGTYSRQSNPVDQFLVQAQKLTTPRYSFYCEDLMALAGWVGEGINRATVLPEHALIQLRKDKKVIFESLGPEAKKELFLAYPIKSKHQVLIKKILEIYKVPSSL